MGKIIKKKTWPDYFEAVRSGKKCFDARIADFDIKEGDILVFQEWNPKTKKYTGREIPKKVSFVLSTKKQKFWKIEDLDKFGLHIVSLKD